LEGVKLPIKNLKLITEEEKGQRDRGTEKIEDIEEIKN
jgi:hypothetical protein